MEDLTGLIIYLILAIIGVLAGIYRNKNRRKSVLPTSAGSSSAEVEQAESYERQFDPFAGIFEETLEDEDFTAENNAGEEESVAEQEADKEETVTGQDVSIEGTYNKGYVEGEAVFTETRDVLVSEEDSGIRAGEISDAESIKDIFAEEESASVTTEQDKSPEKKERFNARKAVIYSEILRRKEY